MPSVDVWLWVARPACVLGDPADLHRQLFELPTPEHVEPIADVHEES
jgi:hypothetical protein